LRPIPKPIQSFRAQEAFERRVGVAKAKGKSGGVRIIYYYWLRDGEVYMLSIYAKNEQTDMTAADRKAARRFVEALKDAKGKS
jgi:hypothetical protein